eukprot:2678063-Prorocentrum_lima.AAC.1
MNEGRKEGRNEGMNIRSHLGSSCLGMQRWPGDGCGCRGVPATRAATAALCPSSLWSSAGS